MSSTELWIAGQRAMPDWARGRMNATIIMISQAATALGGAIWGQRLRRPGSFPRFLWRCLAVILVMVVAHVVLRKRLAIDFTASLNFEPARSPSFPTTGPEAAVSGQGQPGVSHDRISDSPGQPGSMHRLDARSTTDLSEKRRLPMAFVRRPDPTKQIPHGSGSALLERIFAAIRADDQGRKRGDR